MVSARFLAITAAVTVVSIAQVCPAQTSMFGAGAVSRDEQAMSVDEFARFNESFDWLRQVEQPTAIDFSDMIVRGQNPAASSGGGGAGLAAQATNSSAPLSQIQFQNTFIPETYGGSGYANQFVLQPVIAIMNKPESWIGEIFPYHILRPTLPILAPTSDPDGPVSDIGGLGDTTYFDLWAHPIKGQKGNNFLIGPVVVLPTSTNRQLGLGEWQLGPAVAYINTRLIKKTTTGFLFEAPFSTESDAYSMTVQPVYTKLLEGEKWIGIGDLAMKFDDQNGNYNIPLSIQFGKIMMAGDQPFKVFLQPQYTPRGLTSQDSAIYGVKLSVSLLMPGANFGYSKEKEEKRLNKRCNRGCNHCR